MSLSSADDNSLCLNLKQKRFILLITLDDSDA